MPRGDRTGPMGAGPMTGRAAGFCTGARMPGYMNTAQGQWGFPPRQTGAGWWNRLSGGRGWRNIYHLTGLPCWLRGGAGYYPPSRDPEWERRTLKNSANMLQAELDRINRRLEELERDTPSE